MDYCVASLITPYLADCRTHRSLACASRDFACAAKVLKGPIHVACAADVFFCFTRRVLIRLASGQVLCPSELATRCSEMCAVRREDPLKLFLLGLVHGAEGLDLFVHARNEVLTLPRHRWKEFSETDWIHYLLIGYSFFEADGGVFASRTWTPTLATHSFFYDAVALYQATI